MRSRLSLGATPHDIWLSRNPSGYRLHGGPTGDSEVALGGTASRRTLVIDGRAEPVLIALSGDDLHIHLRGRTYQLRYHDPVALHAGEAGGAAEDLARAPMPGTTLAVMVGSGDEVAAGDALVVIESMKLETTIKAPRAGRVEAVHVAAGQSFDRDAVLVTLSKAA